MPNIIKNVNYIVVLCFCTNNTEIKSLNMLFNKLFILSFLIKITFYPHNSQICKLNLLTISFSSINLQNKFF